MRLAAAVGLPIPAIEVHGKPVAYLLVERYDRLRDASGAVKRLHQEDFCQALGILPENKYESEGGPSLAGCFRVLTEESGRLLEDRRNLLRWVIFNALIGNADAIEVKASLVRDYANEMAAMLPDAACRLLREFPDRPLLQKLADLIKINADRLTTRLGPSS